MEHKNDKNLILSHNASTYNELPLTTNAIFVIAESFLPFLHFNVQGKYHSPENIFEACAISIHSLKDFLFFYSKIRKKYWLSTIFLCFFFVFRLNEWHDFRFVKFIYNFHYNHYSIVCLHLDLMWFIYVLSYALSFCHILLSTGFFYLLFVFSNQIFEFLRLGFLLIQCHLNNFIESIVEYCQI